MSAAMASVTWRNTVKGVAHSFCNLVKIQATETTLDRTIIRNRGIPRGDRVREKDRTDGGLAVTDIVSER